MGRGKEIKGVLQPQNKVDIMSIFDWNGEEANLASIISNSS